MKLMKKNTNQYFFPLVIIERIFLFLDKCYGDITKKNTNRQMSLIFDEILEYTEILDLKFIFLN